MNPITLNTQQREAVDAIHAFVNGSNRMFTLEGYAGTGKTTSVQRFIMEHGSSGVVLAAPTHKALKVISRMSEENRLNVQSETIHKWLRLKVIQKGEKEVLEKLPGTKNNPLDDVRIIILDECSMVGDDLYYYIEESLREFNRLKFVFMGDPMQIPPVNGGADSKTFLCSQKYTLTHVMRQRKENPVLAVCTDIRDMFYSGDYKAPVIEPGISEDGDYGVSVMVGQSFTEYMPFAFKKSVYDSDMSRFKCIAYTNDQVDWMNSHIHNMRYESCNEWLAVGEPVTFVKPCILSMVADSSDIANISADKDDEIVVNTETEGRVIFCKKAVHPYFPDIPAWITRIRIDDENESEISVWSLDNIGKSVWQTILDSESRRNNQLIKDGKRNNASWYRYYSVKKAFALIRPSYVTTAHKSQGSTFENVFVDVIDIMRMHRNKADAMKCLYTACSRASHHLIVNYSGFRA